MSTATIVRTNHHPDPRATAVGSLWGYQLGTGETAATTLVTESTPKRTNLIRNPRSVASGTQWTQGGGTSGANYTADNITGWTQNVVPGVTTARRLTLTNAAGVTSLYFRPTPTAATDGVPVTPGMFAGCKAVVETSRAIPVRAFMQFYDAAGTFVSSSAPTIVTTAAGVPQAITNVGVVPAGAAFMIPYIGQGSAAAGQANGDVWLCSAAIDAQASTEAGALAMLAEPYFDGDTPNTGDTTYAWTGTANASTSTATFNDGPLLPDGSRIGTYIRRTITALKTGGTSGPWCRVPNGTYTLVPGDQVSPTMYVRFSVEVTAAVQSSTRSGSGITSTSIETVTIPANTWTRIGQMVTATAAADNTQVWAALAAGTVLPVGTTVDTTGGQSELGEVTPYLDGTLAPTTLPDGSTLVRSWTGAANASASIETRVPALLSAYVEPGSGRVRLEVFGGDPGAGLYLFRRDSAGVGIVRDTSEGTAGFPSLTVEDRNLFPYPKPASSAGWAGSAGVSLRGGDLGGEPALVVSRATIGAAAAWAPSAAPAAEGVAPVAGQVLRIDAQWLPMVAGSYTLRLRTYDDADALVETVASSTVAIATGDLGSWRDVTLSGPVTADAVYARLEVAPTYAAPNIAPNPSFETDVSSVLFAGSGVVTADRSTFGATVGSYALACTLIGTPNTFTWVGERVPAGAVGTWVGFSVDATWQAGSSWMRAAIVWRNGSGAQVGSTVFGSYVQLTGTAQRLSVAGQVPSGAVYADVITYIYSTNAGAAPAAGTLYAMDGLMASNGHASSAAALAAVATYKAPPVGDLYAVRRIVQRQGDTLPTGSWFDGDSVSSDPARGYGWDGAPDASPSTYGLFAAGVFYDYEARQGESADYILSDDDGVLLASVSLSIPLWGTWLKSPGRPSRNVRCYFGSESEVRRRARREAYDVEGSSQVVITAGVRARPEGSLTLVTRDAVTARAMHLLLDDGATLMLDTPPSWGVSFRYLSVGDVSVVRPLVVSDGYQNLPAEARVFELADVVAEAVPSGVTSQDPGRTYATVGSLFATYAAIAATVATYDDLATGEA